MRFWSEPHWTEHDHLLADRDCPDLGSLGPQSFVSTSRECDHKDGQTKRSASRGAEWNSVRSKKCAALASDQHYAGEPDWFRETNPGLSLCEVVSALDHQHSEALRRPQLDPRAGAVSLGEALTIHRPDMLRATNTIR